MRVGRREDITLPTIMHSRPQNSAFREETGTWCIHDSLNVYTEISNMHIPPSRKVEGQKDRAQRIGDRHRANSICLVVGRQISQDRK